MTRCYHTELLPRLCDDPGPQGQAWRTLPPRTLRTLLRIAKDEKKGTRPFFADPREMIALRDHVHKLEA